MQIDDWLAIGLLVAAPLVVAMLLYSKRVERIETKKWLQKLEDMPESEKERTRLEIEKLGSFEDWQDSQ
jgi:biopolymer transport protein ExbB/TolQ